MFIRKIKLYNVGVFGEPNKDEYMKIIYFTTALKKEDYVAFSSAWESLNTSIQNLHNRLIRALALTHQVEVISIRPFSRKYCKLKKLEIENKTEGKISWHYVGIRRLKISRYLSVKAQCKKIMNGIELNDAIVITDTLNPNVLNNSTALAKKYNLPIIGVCNNTPSMIKAAGPSYTKYLLNKASNLSGYITLTPGLNELFNKSNRANMSFEGILDTKTVAKNKNQYGKYIFYNGSLEERFGVYELIKAFKELDNPGINLYISGYHGNKEHLEKAIGDSHNIINMGMLQSDDVVSFANQSLVNINPCPYSEDYDRYLIPDNIVDYLNADSVLVSVRNRHFKKYFDNDAIWIKSNEIYDLLKGLKSALNLAKEKRSELIKKANTDANKLYSMQMINHRTILFLKQFLKQKD